MRFDHEVSQGIDRPWNARREGDDTMDRHLEDLPRELLLILRRELLRLARLEDDMAANEAAAVPYWAPHPPSVLGHRKAAAALRNDAGAILDMAA